MISQKKSENYKNHKRTKSISLARNILRAETAAIAATTIVSYKLENTLNMRLKFKRILPCKSVAKPLLNMNKGIYIVNIIYEYSLRTFTWTSCLFSTIYLFCLSFSVSVRLKMRMRLEIAVKRKSVPFKWKRLSRF